jgi:hypothetical protein
MKMLMADDDNNSKQKSSGFNFLTYDNIKTNNNKNRFMKELQLYSYKRKLIKAFDEDRHRTEESS